MLSSFTLNLDNSSHCVAELAGSIPVVMLEVLNYCPALDVRMLPGGRAGIVRVQDPLSRALLLTK